MHNINLVDLSMKFTTSRLSSSHIIGVAILSSKLLNKLSITRLIEDVLFVCVCEREREREGLDKGVP